MLINFFVFLKNHVLQIYNFHMTSWAQIFSTFLVQIFLFSSFFYDSLQQQPSEKYYVNKLEFKICFQQSVLDYYYQQIVIILMYCKQQLQLLVDIFGVDYIFQKNAYFYVEFFQIFLCSMHKHRIYAQNFVFLRVKWQPQLYVTLLIILDRTFYLFSWYIYIQTYGPYFYQTVYFSFVTSFLFSFVFLLFLFFQFYLQLLECAFYVSSRYFSFLIHNPYTFRQTRKFCESYHNLICDGRQVFFFFNLGFLQTTFSTQKLKDDVPLRQGSESLYVYKHRYLVHNMRCKM
eukprot:TRINITY_DN1448_c0_g1_i12.p1 TRINITY_DN1448_c0_g1~~TRINITY_DN1448_c0_g1_i12.p1  ORF type:complete len:288 (+),score=-42.12 TRINITY_DN1448_c0_g1_i12:108-971(+)